MQIEGLCAPSQVFPRIKGPSRASLVVRTRRRPPLQRSRALVHARASRVRFSLTRSRIRASRVAALSRAEMMHAAAAAAVPTARLSSRARVVVAPTRARSTCVSRSRRAVGTTAAATAVDARTVTTKSGCVVEASDAGEGRARLLVRVPVERGKGCAYLDLRQQSLRGGRRPGPRHALPRDVPRLVAQAVPAHLLHAGRARVALLLARHQRARGARLRLRRPVVARLHVVAPCEERRRGKGALLMDER